MRDPSVKIGTVQDVCGSLEEYIEASDIFSVLKESDVDRNAECSLCKVRYFCGGGCKANRILGGFANDPHCAWYKPLYLAGVRFANTSSPIPNTASVLREYMESGRWKDDECT